MKEVGAIQVGTSNACSKGFRRGETRGGSLHTSNTSGTREKKRRPRTVGCGKVVHVGRARRQQTWTRFMLGRRR